MPDDTGDHPLAPAAAPQARATPFSLRFLEDARVIAAPGAPGAPAPDPDPLPILRALDEKTRALSDSEGVLEALLNTDDLTKHDKIGRQLDDVVSEKLACRARFTAINHGGPFKQPPDGEEKRLLAAINAVSQAVNDTQRWQALLTAVDGLVQAYAAKDTKKALVAAAAAPSEDD